jgi:quinol-cytochrome oxidoreductase complex cytochrome b subunit
MCAIMGFTLLIFVIYHFYLIWKGNTTNERVKKNDDVDFYAKELGNVEKLEKKFEEGTTEIEWKG